MTEFVPDDPTTMDWLDSIAALMEWSQSMPASVRAQFWSSLAASTAATQQKITGLIAVAKSPEKTQAERQEALQHLAATLWLRPNERPDVETDTPESVADSSISSAASELPPRERHAIMLDTDAERLPTNRVAEAMTQQTAFVRRVRELMAAKHLSQQELAGRVGCSQAAVSLMLNRNSRPQKKTILKFAEALGVSPRDLWPDMEVAELLDAVASFQEDDYVMTEAEARALRDPSKRNRPTIPAKSLPTRRRPE